MINIYLAYDVHLQGENIGHVTVAFFEPRDTSKLRLHQLAPTIISKITSIDYWKKPNITAARLEDDVLKVVQHVLSNLGFTYDFYEFKPHITLGLNNIIHEKDFLFGKEVELVNPYIRVKNFGR